MTYQNPTQEIYTALESAYQHFNQALFASQLPSCLIVLQRQPRMMGYASHQRWINGAKQMVDELAINPEYFLGHPLLEVMQTLVHEQCHIWQFHFGTPSRRTYHNREWADKMESIGLMPSTTGKPGGRRTGQSVSDYVIYGGAFQEAFYELRGQGFLLPWLDRRPHLPEKHVAAGVYDREGNPALSAIPDNEAAVLQEHLGVVFSSDPDTDEENQSQDQEGVSGQATPGAVLLPIMPVAAKKTTRVKYRCPGCGNQAWGKPAMAIVCGDCEEPFRELN